MSEGLLELGTNIVGEIDKEATKSMFTDVDLAALGEDELAWAVLGNLAKHTRVTARPPAG